MRGGLCALGHVPLLGFRPPTSVPVRPPREGFVAQSARALCGAPGTAPAGSHHHEFVRDSRAPVPLTGTRELATSGPALRALQATSASASTSSSAAPRRALGRHKAKLEVDTPLYIATQMGPRRSRSGTSARARTSTRPGTTRPRRSTAAPAGHAALGHSPARGVPRGLQARVRQPRRQYYRAHLAESPGVSGTLFTRHHGFRARARRADALASLDPGATRRTGPPPPTSAPGRVCGARPHQHLRSGGLRHSGDPGQVLRLPVALCGWSSRQPQRPPGVHQGTATEYEPILQAP